MSESQVAGTFPELDERRLIDFVASRRWFGSKTQELTHARVVDSAVLRGETPVFALAIVEVRFHAGTHELYQLFLGFRSGEGEWQEDVITAEGGWIAYDALCDPVFARELLSLLASDATLAAGEGMVEFVSADTGLEAAAGEPRLLAVEQSNSSVVYGDRLILKAYRRLEAGTNPELEVLRFLSERGFPNVAALAGWYAYEGPVMDLTLGIVQRFIPNAKDGWELALEELARDPDAFLGRVRRLGEVTAALHTVLAADAADPDFAPEEPSHEALALLTATVDEEIEEIFLDLPDNEALAPIAGRGEEVRDRLRLISHVGPVGRVIRHHGDYHLGQVLWNGEDWFVLDFEGEPARSLHERRNKRSPLRDVAGMLRSFAYVVSMSELRGKPPPESWEERAREEFLAAYFANVDRSVIPPNVDSRMRLLSVFELEKAVYELRYELNNRPDWVGIPVAGIMRLLQADL